jgi:hypothetical protein
MNIKDRPDFTDNFKKIFQLAENTRKLRKAFSFSQTDSRAAKDRAMIKKWKSIAAMNQSRSYSHENE